MILGLFPFPRYCLGRLVMNYPGPQRPYFWGHSTTRPSVPAFEKYVNSKVQIRLFTLKKKKDFIFSYVWACMCPQRPEEGAGSPGAKL